MFLLTSEDVIRITINGRKYCMVYLYIELFHSLEIRKNRISRIRLRLL